MTYKYKVEVVYLRSLEEHLNKRGEEGWSFRSILPSTDNVSQVVVVLECR